MERIVYNRLYMYLMRNNLWTWRNSGYKKSDGTTNQLVNIVDEIYNNMDYGLDTYMVYWMHPRPLTEYGTKVFSLN